MLWTLLSIIIVLMHVAALLSPQWLLGTEDVVLSGVTASSGNRQNSTTTVQYRNTETYTPTMGILTRCKQIYTARSEYNYVTCSYYGSFTDIPSGLWQAMVVFYCLGLLILCITGLASILSLCVRSVCKKSIFTLAGFIQAVAGRCNDNINFMSLLFVFYLFVCFIFYFYFFYFIFFFCCCWATLSLCIDCTCWDQNQAKVAT